MSLAFVFPGQGSQSLGMLSDFFNTSIVVNTLSEASSVLGYDLQQLITTDEQTLNSTEFTQPALLACSVALYRLWRAEGGPEPVVMAGHSLGEYSALVCADALSFEAGLRLVSTRGQYMQSAVRPGEGAMAAIIGLENDRIAEICDQASLGEVLSPANFNAIGQTVIAGTAAAVERAIAIAEQEARMVVPLPVSVPSHCALMLPAANEFKSVLQAVDWQTPRIPVIHNVDLSEASDPHSIQIALEQQLYSPVRWVETVTTLIGRGVTQMVECGPGKVLSGLNKRIARQIPIGALETQSAFESTRLSLIS